MPRKADSARRVLLSALAALLLVSPIGAEAARFSRERLPREGESPRHSVVEVVSMRRLVERGLLEYRPQEIASPSRDDFTGEIAVGTRDGKLHLLDTSGREIWIAALGEAPSGPAFFSDSAILVGTTDGLLYALDRFSGEVVWTASLRAQVLMPMAEDFGTLVVGTDRDEVYAIDIETGESLWVYRRSVPRALSVRGGVGVAVEDGRIFAGFSDGSLVALGVEEGRILWEAVTTGGAAQRFADADATPVVRDGTVYGTVFNDGVYAFDARTGGLKWRHAASGAHSLRLHEDLLLIGGARKALGISAETGARRWSLPLGDGYVERPTVARRLAFLPGPQGIRIVEAKTGRPLEFFQPGSGFSGSVVEAGDRVFALSNLGILYELRLVAP